MAIESSSTDCPTGRRTGDACVILASDPNDYVYGKCSADGTSAGSVNSGACGNHEFFTFNCVIDMSKFFNM